MGAGVFLNYDVDWLLDQYPGECPLLGELPYTELACFLDAPAPALTVSRETGPFHLASEPPAELARLQANAYAAFREEKRVDRDSTVIRLEGYDRQKRELAIRPCRYADGLRSNYAMDWKAGVSLRSVMSQAYGATLPPLNEARLSNAIGVAVIVWHRTEQGDVVPYLPRRAESEKGSAVFPGGYHSTASGEVEWNPNAATFDDLFTAHICEELREEVGLIREDLDWIAPVALCREFLRGGKPQLFYAAFTKVPASELGRRRRTAIERQIARGRQEIADDFLVVTSTAQLDRDLAMLGTIEARANMVYAQRCAGFVSQAVR